MPVPSNLKEFLEVNHISYRAFTSKRNNYRTIDILKEAPVPESCVVKSIVLKANDRFILAVLNVGSWIDFERLKQELGTVRLRMATEAELASLFPEWELGAISPFGNLYGLEVWIDKSLTRNEQVLFKAGSHTETILMQYRDFEMLVGPRIANFSGGKPWL